MNLNSGLLNHLFDGNIPLWVGLLAFCGVIIAAYLLGSINSAIIISRMFYGEDVRTKGSGNAGTTNMLRNYGKKAALFTLLGDMMKTVIAIFIAGFIFGFGYVKAISVSEPCYVAGLFAVMGHVFPVFYKFKGGKGVLSTATMVAVLSPIVLAVLLLAFIAIVSFTKFVSLGSVTGCILYPIVLNGYFVIAFDNQARPMPSIVLTSIILSVLIVWCHRENLGRISRGEEHKLSFSKKPEAASEDEDDMDEDSCTDIDGGEE